MTENELKNYKQAFWAENAEPEVCKSSANQKWHNVPGSSGRHAWHGVTWIEYWRAFSETYSNKMTCSCCGKEIFVSTDAVDAKFTICVNQNAYPETEDVQACGGHVYIPTDGNDEFVGGVYITPLCKKCNNSTVDSLELKKGSLLVSEVGAMVDGE